MQHDRQITDMMKNSVVDEKAKVDAKHAQLRELADQLDQRGTEIEAQRAHVSEEQHRVDVALHEAECEKVSSFAC